MFYCLAALTAIGSKIQSRLSLGLPREPKPKPERFATPALDDLNVPPKVLEVMAEEGYYSEYTSKGCRASYCRNRDTVQAGTSVCSCPEIYRKPNTVKPVRHVRSVRPLKPVKPQTPATPKTPKTPVRPVSPLQQAGSTTASFCASVKTKVSAMFSKVKQVIARALRELRRNVNSPDNPCFDEEQRSVLLMIKCCFQTCELLFPYALSAFLWLKPSRQCGGYNLRIKAKTSAAFSKAGQLTARVFLEFRKNVNSPNNLYLDEEQQLVLLMIKCCFWTLDLLFPYALSAFSRLKPPRKSGRDKSRTRREKSICFSGLVL